MLTQKKRGQQSKHGLPNQGSDKSKQALYGLRHLELAPDQLKLSFFGQITWVFWRFLGFILGAWAYSVKQTSKNKVNNLLARVDDGELNNSRDQEKAKTLARDLWQAYSDQEPGMLASIVNINHKNSKNLRNRALVYAQVDLTNDTEIKHFLFHLTNADGGSFLEKFLSDAELSLNQHNNPLGEKLWQLINNPDTLRYINNNYEMVLKLISDKANIVKPNEFFSNSLVLKSAVANREASVRIKDDLNKNPQHAGLYWVAYREQPACIPYAFSEPHHHALVLSKAYLYVNAERRFFYSLLQQSNILSKLQKNGSLFVCKEPGLRALAQTIIKILRTPAYCKELLAIPALANALKPDFVIIEAACQVEGHITKIFDQGSLFKRKGRGKLRKAQQVAKADLARLLHVVRKGPHEVSAALVEQYGDQLQAFVEQGGGIEPIASNQANKKPKQKPVRANVVPAKQNTTEQSVKPATSDVQQSNNDNAKNKQTETITNKHATQRSEQEHKRNVNKYIILKDLWNNKKTVTDPLIKKLIGEDLGKSVWPQPLNEFIDEEQGSAKYSVDYLLHHNIKRLVDVLVIDPKTVADSRIQNAFHKSDSFKKMLAKHVVESDSQALYDRLLGIKYMDAELETAQPNWHRAYASLQAASSESQSAKKDKIELKMIGDLVERAKEAGLSYDSIFTNRYNIYETWHNEMYDFAEFSKEMQDYIRGHLLQVFAKYSQRTSLDIISVSSDIVAGNTSNSANSEIVNTKDMTLLNNALLLCQQALGELLTAECVAGSTNYVNIPVTLLAAVTEDVRRNLWKIPYYREQLVKVYVNKEHWATLVDQLISKKLDPVNEEIVIEIALAVAKINPALCTRVLLADHACKAEHLMNKFKPLAPVIIHFIKSWTPTNVIQNKAMINHLFDMLDDGLDSELINNCLHEKFSEAELVQVLVGFVTTPKNDEALKKSPQFIRSLNEDLYPSVSQVSSACTRIAAFKGNLTIEDKMQLSPRMLADAIRSSSVDRGEFIKKFFAKQSFRAKIYANNELVNVLNSLSASSSSEFLRDIRVLLVKDMLAEPNGELARDARRLFLEYVQQANTTGDVRLLFSDKQDGFAAEDIFSIFKLYSVEEIQLLLGNPVLNERVAQYAVAALPYLKVKPSVDFFYAVFTHAASKPIIEKWFNHNNLHVKNYWRDLYFRGNNNLRFAMLNNNIIIRSLGLKAETLLLESEAYLSSPDVVPATMPIVKEARSVAHLVDQEFLNWFSDKIGADPDLATRNFNINKNGDRVWNTFKKEPDRLQSLLDNLARISGVKRARNFFFFSKSLHDEISPYLKAEKNILNDITHPKVGQNRAISINKALIVYEYRLIKYDKLDIPARYQILWRLIALRKVFFNQPSKCVQNDLLDSLLLYMESFLPGEKLESDAASQKGCKLDTITIGILKSSLKINGEWLALRVLRSPILCSTMSCNLLYHMSLISTETAKAVILYQHLHSRSFDDEQFNQIFAKGFNKLPAETMRLYKSSIFMRNFYNGHPEYAKKHLPGGLDEVVVAPVVEPDSRDVDSINGTQAPGVPQVANNSSIAGQGHSAVSVDSTTVARTAVSAGSTMPLQTVVPAGSTIPLQTAVPAGSTMPLPTSVPVGTTMPAQTAVSEDSVNNQSAMPVHPVVYVHSAAPAHTTGRENPQLVVNFAAQAVAPQVNINADLPTQQQREMPRGGLSATLSVTQSSNAAVAAAVSPIPAAPPPPPETAPRITPLHDVSRRRGLRAAMGAPSASQSNESMLSQIQTGVILRKVTTTNSYDSKVENPNSMIAKMRARNSALTGGDDSDSDNDSGNDSDWRP